MLVPLKSAQKPSRRGTEERTLTPGAVTSGFRRSERGVGPPEEKSAIVGPSSSSAATEIARAELAGEVIEPGPKSE